MEFSDFWANPKDSVEKAAYEILWGFTLEQYKNAIPRLMQLPKEVVFDKYQSVLDYGCGMGRFGWHAGRANPGWAIQAFDNPVMLDRIHKVWGSEYPKNVVNKMSYESIKTAGEAGVFDLINAELVLQHLKEPLLRTVTADLANFLRASASLQPRLIFTSRRTLDDAKTSCWKIVLEEFDIQHVWGYGNTEVSPGHIEDGHDQDHLVFVLTPKLKPLD